MMPKYLFIPLFFIMCLLQWFISFKTIFTQHDVLKTGVVYKFKTSPVDPVDAFRGRYIQLRFEDTNIRIDSSLIISSGQNVYALLATDKNGFAKIAKISTDKPDNTSDYFTATVSYTYKDSSDMVALQFPFDRYFMEESKAPQTEKYLNQIFQEGKSSVYAKVRVKKGLSSLEDVIVDSLSVREWYEKQKVK